MLDIVARTLALAVVLHAAAPASAQTIEATIGVPDEPSGRVIRATIDLGAPTLAIEGCFTDRGLRCTRTRRVVLGRAARAELDALLAAIRAMPRCEPIGFAPGDPDFAITLPGEAHPRTGHLPRDPSLSPSRTDEPCEAEHALAAWIVRRF
jgi:hypothetical protein